MLLRHFLNDFVMVPLYFFFFYYYYYYYYYYEWLPVSASLTARVSEYGLHRVSPGWSRPLIA
jgi:hypothetical protein